SADGEGTGSSPGADGGPADDRPSSASWAFVIDAGAVAAAPSITADAQVGGAASLGARLRLGPLLSELVVGTRWVSNMDTERPEGTLQLREIGVALGGRTLYATEHLAIGGLVEPSLRLLDVEGRTPRGASGSSFRVLPALLLGPELRWLIGDRVHLRGSAGVEFALQRQRFSINDQVQLDIGVARAVAQLGLVCSLP
ncbi:MAG: hypothetical protein JRI68_21065, partial [Deltaproteobacteria bacterium]|nr:hypothetical protein [Deltaproteobacteria bacterium]